MPIEGEVVQAAGLGGQALWLLATACLTVLGGVFALLKWFVSRMLTDIETRLLRIDAVEDKIERMLSELPIHYRRREDAIRETSALAARVDALGQAMFESVRREDYLRDVAVLHAKIDALSQRLDRVLELRERP